ncbi:MAG: hypothetical protein AAGA23_08420 [Pseudomonadota bacterium]
MSSLGLQAPRSGFGGLALDLTRDFRTVWRNGFFVAVLVITALHIGTLLWVGDFLRPWMVSMVLIEVFTFNGFFLAGVLMLLEKGENSLAALSLSPLPAGRWLRSRCLLLTFLAWLECLAVCAFLWPAGLTASLLSAAITTPLLALLGIAFTSRYRGFSEFLMPSVAVFMVLMLPLLRLAGFSQHWVFWLHPLTPGVVLLEYGDPTGVPAVTALALTLGVVWILLAYRLALTVSQHVLAWR